MPDVSVTLVLYNSADHLSGCLASLRPDVDSGSAEVIAVDNSTPDDSVDILMRELPEARLIRSAHNVGFAAGCNLAWPEVRGRYWLLLNPDVALEPQALRALVRYMDGHPRVGAASAWLRNPGSDEAVNPAREFPSIAKALLELWRLRRLLPAGEPSAADWVPGTAFMVRPEAVHEAGLPRPDFFLYGEDLEWCWRIRQAEWEIGTCAQSVAVHHESSSSARTWSRTAVDARIARGILDACEVIHGDSYARVYGLLMALATGIEARHPRRSAEFREHSLADSRAWRSAALRRPITASKSAAKAPQDVDPDDAGIQAGEHRIG